MEVNDIATLLDMDHSSKYNVKVWFDMNSQLSRRQRQCFISVNVSYVMNIKSKAADVVFLWK